MPENRKKNGSDDTPKTKPAIVINLISPPPIASFFFHFSTINPDKKIIPNYTIADITEYKISKLL